MVQIINVPAVKEIQAVDHMAMAGSLFQLPDTVELALMAAALTALTAHQLLAVLLVAILWTIPSMPTSPLQICENPRLKCS